MNGINVYIVYSRDKERENWEERNSWKMVAKEEGTKGREYSRKMKGEV